MIATVRIAPIERWCPEVMEVFAENPVMAKLVGLPVEIYTANVRTLNECGDALTREWEITEKSNDVIDTIVGETKDPIDGKGNWICEHMLEMD